MAVDNIPKSTDDTPVAEFVPVHEHETHESVEVVKKKKKKKKKKVVEIGSGSSSRSKTHRRRSSATSVSSDQDPPSTSDSTADVLTAASALLAATDPAQTSPYSAQTSPSRPVSLHDTPEVSEAPDALSSPDSPSVSSPPPPTTVGESTPETPDVTEPLADDGIKAPPSSTEAPSSPAKEPAKEQDFGATLASYFSQGSAPTEEVGL